MQRQVFSALSQIAKHSVDLAEMVVEAEIFPAVLTCLKDPDEYVKKNVATLIREISKHTPEVRWCEHFSQIPIKKLYAHTSVCVLLGVGEENGEATGCADSGVCSISIAVFKAQLHGKQFDCNERSSALMYPVYCDI